MDVPATVKASTIKRWSPGDSAAAPAATAPTAAVALLEATTADISAIEKMRAKAVATQDAHAAQIAAAAAAAETAAATFVEFEVAALDAKRGALRRELGALGLNGGGSLSAELGLAHDAARRSASEAEAAATALRESEAAVAPLEEQQLLDRTKTAWGRFKGSVPSDRLLRLARSLRRA